MDSGCNKLIISLRGTITPLLQVTICTLFFKLFNTEFLYRHSHNHIGFSCDRLSLEILFINTKPLSNPQVSLDDINTSEPTATNLDPTKCMHFHFTPHFYRACADFFSVGHLGPFSIIEQAVSQMNSLMMFFTTSGNSDNTTRRVLRFRGRSQSILSLLV